jgi:hypothetical protein
LRPKNGSNFDPQNRNNSQESCFTLLCIGINGSIGMDSHLLQ